MIHKKDIQISDILSHTSTIFNHSPKMVISIKDFYLPLEKYNSLLTPYVVLYSVDLTQEDSQSYTQFNQLFVDSLKNIQKNNQNKIEALMGDHS